MPDEAILFANEAFYAAFGNGDADAMDALWSDATPAACLHPGAPPIFGKDEIMESWRHILGDPGISGMRYFGPRVIPSAAMALVVCYETLGQNTLAATNGFVLENGVWRMVLHQAAPCSDAPAAPEALDEMPSRVH